VVHDDGTYRAWENKNRELNRDQPYTLPFAKTIGIEAYPMCKYARTWRVQPFYTSLAQFNRGVVYVPVDTAKYYVLDATVNIICITKTPAELLNSSGLYIDKPQNKYDIILFEKVTACTRVGFYNCRYKKPVESWKYRADKQQQLQQN